MRYAVMMLIMACMLCGCSEHATQKFQFSDDASMTEESSAKDVRTEEVSADAVIYVDVCGEVNTPGVYCLPERSRVYDAIVAAGGTTDKADTTSVNQARLLTDGEQLIISSAEEKIKNETSQAESDGLVNINTADADTLCTLPGIGEVKAAEIISYRQQNGSFQNIEDLMQVPGIKEALFEGLKDKIKT